MITPANLKMKLFLQELCEKEKEWDERLSIEEITTWKGIMTDLNGIFSIHLPRFVGNGSIQLLCFWDSSSKEYATAIYLRAIKNDKITVSFFSYGKKCTEEETYNPKARTDAGTDWYKEPTFCGPSNEIRKDIMDKFLMCTTVD